MWTSKRVGLFVGPESTQIFGRDPGTAAASPLGLAQTIDSLRSFKGKLEVVLSDEYCRYCVMDRPAGLRNRAELNVAVQNRFRAIFGNVDTWQVAYDAAPFSQRDFVAGVDDQIIQSILGLADAAGLRVMSIRPHFVAWAREFRSQIRRGRHWVVAADKHWLSLGYFQEGQCLQARTLRLNTDTANLEDLLNRERAFISDMDPRARVWLGGSTESLMPLSPIDTTFKFLPCSALWGSGGIRK